MSKLPDPSDRNRFVTANVPPNNQQTYQQSGQGSPTAQLHSESTLPPQIAPNVYNQARSETETAESKKLADEGFRNEYKKMTLKRQRLYPPKLYKWKHKEICLEHDLLPLINRDGHEDAVPPHLFAVCQCRQIDQIIEDFKLVATSSLEGVAERGEKKDKSGNKDRVEICDLVININNGQYHTSIELQSNKIHQIKRYTQPKTLLDKVATVSFHDTRVYWKIGNDYLLCTRLKSRYAKEQLNVSKKQCPGDVSPWWYENHSAHGVKECDGTLRQFIAILHNPMISKMSFHKSLRRIRIELYQRKSICSHVTALLNGKAMRNMETVTARHHDKEANKESSNTNDSKMENDEEDAESDDDLTGSSQNTTGSLEQSSQLSSGSSNQGISRRKRVRQRSRSPSPMLQGGNSEIATVRDSNLSHNRSGNVMSFECPPDLDLNTLTREQLIELVEKKDAEIAELKEENKELAERNLNETVLPVDLMSCYDGQTPAPPPCKKRRCN